MLFTLSVGEKKKHLDCGKLFHVRRWHTGREIAYNLNTCTTFTLRTSAYVLVASSGKNEILFMSWLFATSLPEKPKEAPRRVKKLNK